MIGAHESIKPQSGDIPPSRRRVDALILGVGLLLVITLSLLPTPSSHPSAAPSKELPAWSAESLSPASPKPLRLSGDGLEGWTATTDEAMGGTSHVELQRVDGALRVHGELGEEAAFPWAGGTLAVGTSLRTAADISGHRALRFRLRGDGRQVAVMVISGASRHMPPTQFVIAETDWTEFSLDLDDFMGADLKAVQGIAFSAVQTPGRFAFEIDDVELH